MLLLVLLITTFIQWVTSELCTAVPCPQNDVNCTLMVAHLGTFGNAIFQGHSQTMGNSTVQNLIVEQNIRVGEGDHFARVSITPREEGPKINLWSHHQGDSYRGIGVSPKQLNYHVAKQTESHVFYSQGTNGDGSELIRFRGDGRVAIGSSESTSKVQITHTSNYEWREYDQHAFLIKDNQQNLYMGADLTHQCSYLQSWGETTFRPLLLNAKGGNVGIGTSDPSAPLHVKGKIIADQFVAPSKRAWKENIEPIVEALELLKKMQPVEYTWKKGYGDNRKENALPQVHRGFIAEDFAKIYPGAVDDIKSPSGIDYSTVVAILVAGVKDLSNLVKSIENRLEDLERTNAQL